MANVRLDWVAEADNPDAPRVRWDIDVSTDLGSTFNLAPESLNTDPNVSSVVLDLADGLYRFHIYGVDADGERSAVPVVIASHTAAAVLPAGGVPGSGTATNV